MSEALLREAIDLLKRIWLAYREETYADQTDQIIWKSAKRLVLRSGLQTVKKRPDTSSPLLVFPEYLCKKAHDNVILLNFLQCNVAVKHMQCILEWLLEGLSDKIEVAVFLLRDPPLIVTLEPDGSNLPIRNADYRHVCWRITLTSGEAYAVDLTGAQYGYLDPVCHWDECLERRVLATEALRIGFRDDEHVAPLIASDAGIPGFTPPNVDSYYASVQDHFTQSMTAHLQDLQAADFLKAGMGQGQYHESEELVADVRKRAKEATLAADRIWDTFTWNDDRDNHTIMSDEYWSD